MIQAKQISKNFGTKVLFADQSFHLQGQERVGLVGRNGQGKTTLLKVLTGEMLPDGGQVQLPKNYRLGYLSQHIHLQSPTVLEEAALGLQDEEKESLFKAKKCLAGLGFDEEMFLLSPQKLSGGYQLRLQLAKVILSDPDCLMLDEPTNYLDLVASKWLIQFLRNWNKECLLISHDRYFLDQVCTHIMGLHRGKIKKIEGQTDKYYQQLLDEEELHGKTIKNQEQQVKKMEAFVEKNRAKASKAKQAQSRLKAISKMNILDRLQDLEELDFVFPYDPCPGKVFLEAKNVQYQYEGQTAPMFSGLSLSVGKGDRLGIIGKNGKGKSTLLRMLACDLPLQIPADITNPLLKPSLYQHPSLKVRYFGQTNIQRLYGEHTIYEEIAQVDSLMGQKQVRAICGHMLFSGDDAEKKIKVLSGGEKARVLLGKILAANSNVLLLDEPTHHLDMESIESLCEALEDYPGAVVIVTHDEEILSRLCNRLVIFDQGQAQLLEGTYEDFLSKGGFQEMGGGGSETRAQEGEAVKKISQKDYKRMRSEMIKKRSEAVNPLKKKTEEIERQIISKEEEVKQLQEELLQDSKTFDYGKNGKKQKILEEQLDQLYLDLEKNELVREAREKEFDDLLAALEQA